MKNLDLQFLQKELERVTNFIQLSDRKSAFLSVYYSVVLGVLISFYNEDIFNLCDFFNFFILILFVTILILFFIGFYFLFSSVFPKLDNNLTTKSLFFFGTISSYKYLDFSKKMEELDEPEARKGIIEQIYTNSDIANKKMKSIKISIKILFLLVALLFLLILISN